MSFCKKVKKTVLGYPFILGILTSILINFGGLWMVKVRELALSEVRYTIVAKSSEGLFNPENHDNGNDDVGVGGTGGNQESRDIVVSDAEVPMLDYDPGEQVPLYRMVKLFLIDEFLLLKKSIIDFYATVE